MSTATVFEMQQTANTCEPTRRQRAASLIAQAWAELRCVEGREAREMCSTLRALVPRVENIREAR